MHLFDRYRNYSEKISAHIKSVDAILPQSRLPFVYGRLSHYSETVGDACSLNKHNFTSPHQSTTKRLCMARHLPLVNWRELISQFPQRLQGEIFITLYQIEKYIAFI